MKMLNVGFNGLGFYAVGALGYRKIYQKTKLGATEKENAEILQRFQRFSLFGRSVGIRTRGLLDPNQARYQASPHPVNSGIIMNIFPIVK